MPGQYGRNRNPEGRSTSGSRGGQDWRDDDDYGRENFGRGQQPPRDDRGRFLSEGENRDYYGGERQYGQYEDNGRGDFGGRGFGGRDYEERGYEDSRGGRGNYGYEQDDNYRGGSRGQQRGMFGRGDYEDRSGRERDEYGRFTGDDNYGGPRAAVGADTTTTIAVLADAAPARDAGGLATHKAMPKRRASAGVRRRSWRTRGFSKSWLAGAWRWTRARRVRPLRQRR